jgi:hypothetical protein
MTELFGLGLFGLGLGLFGSVFGLRLIMPRVSARTPPGRRRRRCARRCPLECESEPPHDVGGRDEAVGANHVAGKLVAGELWPAKVVAAVVSAGAEADQRGRPVSDSSERKTNFSFSRNVKIVLELVNFITNYWYMIKS